jgi:glycosyltransferase involved in cell wall biosynthesis
MFFSIIIPVYNGELTILSTVNSILSQTLQDFEILIINDGSNDNTLKLLNTLNDSRIQIINIVNSGGPAKPRNIGIHLAKGNYICFIDADDTWSTNKLEFSHNILKNKPFDVLYHQLLNTSNNQILQTRILNNNNPYEDLLLNGNAISLSGSIVSKNFIINNKIKFNESYDKFC